MNPVFRWNYVNGMSPKRDIPMLQQFRRKAEMRRAVERIEAIEAVANLRSKIEYDIFLIKEVFGFVYFADDKRLLRVNEELVK